MKNLSRRSRLLCVNALCAAAYAALTLALAPLSFGALQLRVSEALCILPFFLPATTWGLTLGCALANLLSGSVPDVIFGSLATLLAGLCTGFFGRKPQAFSRQLLACLMPVLFNGLMVGGVVTWAYNGLLPWHSPAAFWLNTSLVALGEAAVLFALGLPLLRKLQKQSAFREFVEKCD